MKWPWAAMVIVAVTIVGLAVAQQSDPGITIHAEGTLGEIIDMLREEHEIYLGVPGVPGGIDKETHITLDLDDATRLQVVREVCLQLGAIYYHSASGSFDRASLRRGDLSIDPRPRAMAGLYAVSVTGVVIDRRRSVTFSLGESESRGRDRHTLTIGFEVEPPTAEAEELLWGVWREASIVTDTGQELVNESSVVRLQPLQWCHPTLRTGSSSLSFPPPDGPATRIARLSGVVAAVREVTHASCRFGHDEVGVTKELGDVGCKLTQWQRLDEEVRVDFEVLSGTDGHRDRAMDLQVRLVDADGQTARYSGSTTQYGAKRTLYKQSFGELPSGDLQLTLKATVWHGPMQWHNFVIEDIPLP